MPVCVCVRVCACARVCVRGCVRLCACADGQDTGAGGFKTAVFDLRGKVVSVRIHADDFPEAFKYCFLKPKTQTQNPKPVFLNHKS